MIPFLDLKAQYRSLKPEIDAAVLEVLESSQFVLGEKVAAFERQFAAYAGCEHAVALNTGTSALHLALLALGVGPGDEVITIPMTFVATAAAICYTGARAVLVDVDPQTWTMDAAKLEAAITPSTKVILPVHLHGLMADMTAILEIAGRRGIAVVEDAAQAHGAEQGGRRAGSLGAIGCFSFYPGKNLGAYGEGGAATTNNSEYAQKMRLLRDWGQDRKYHHQMVAYNYRMDGVQGAVLGVKMKSIESWTEGRRAAAAKYDRHFANSGVITPSSPSDRRHVYHVYAVRVPNRDAVAAELTKEGIATGIHYPLPVHLQPGYAQLGYRRGDFPVSEMLGDEFLSLPMYAELTDAQIDEVAAAVKRAVSRQRRD